MTVDDVNDNTPRFTGTTTTTDGGGYTATVNGDAALGTTVLTVTATDSDVGVNGLVVYEINRSGSSSSIGMDRIIVLIEWTEKLSVIGKSNLLTSHTYFGHILRRIGLPLFHTLQKMGVFVQELQKCNFFIPEEGNWWTP